MRFIAHRGNLNGPTYYDVENHPDYIQAALSKGFDVEVDVWYLQNKWLLGHDSGYYEIDESFLHKPGLWIHAKNFFALDKLTKKFKSTPMIEAGLNFFFHNEDAFTLTSKNFVWTYPSQYIEVGANSVAVMPEWFQTDPSQMISVAGICSNYIEPIRDEITKILAGSFETC